MIGFAVNIYNSVLIMVIDTPFYTPYFTDQLIIYSIVIAVLFFILNNGICLCDTDSTCLDLWSCWNKIYLYHFSETCILNWNVMTLLQSVQINWMIILRKYNQKSYNRVSLYDRKIFDNISINISLSFCFF